MSIWCRVMGKMGDEEINLAIIVDAFLSMRKESNRVSLTQENKSRNTNKIKHLEVSLNLNLKTRIIDAHTF
jgi:hypothetical protein